MYAFGLSIALVLFIWHLICSLLSVIEYSVWVRRLPEWSISPQLKHFHLAFSVIGLIAFALGGAPLFMYAYKYGLSYRQRFTRLLCGAVVVFFTWSLPFAAIEGFMVAREVTGLLSDVMFALSLISFAVGVFVVWFGYMHFVASICHRYHGVDRQVPHGDAVHAMRPIGPTSAVLPSTI